MTTVQFTSWSPSRFADYEQCPLMAKLKHLDKLCPMCFKGKIHGGFDTPAICDTCGKEVEKPAAIVRGTVIGDHHDLFVTAKVNKLHAEVRNPKVLEISKAARTAFIKGKARVQLDVVLTRSWRPCKGWDKEAWARFKLDFFQFINGKEGRVIDWKTGGIDKRTGAVRVESKYDDQLDGYAVASLCVFPQITRVTGGLVFLDTGPRFDPVVERPTGTLERADLAKRQDGWIKKLKPMMSDTKFSPRPCDHCRFCTFAKAKGGPCRY